MTGPRDVMPAGRNSAGSVAGNACKIKKAAAVRTRDGLSSLLIGFAHDRSKRLPRQAASARLRPAHGSTGREGWRMSSPRIPVDLTPEQILAAARVLVRAVLAKMKPEPAVVEAVAANVARVLPGYGSPPVHPAPISVPDGQAVPRVTDPRLPHWIVRNQTPRGPGEFKPRHFFMHPTQELAEAEARRMAKRLPGNYFAVYASGAVFYEEVPPPPPVEGADA